MASRTALTAEFTEALAENAGRSEILNREGRKGREVREESPRTSVRGDALIARAVFDPNWRTHEAEGMSDLVFQKTLVRKMEFHGPIGEEDEGGGRDGGLGHVVDFHALTDGNGGALEVDVFQEAVHLAGSDALAALGGDFLDKGQNLVGAFACGR